MYPLPVYLTGIADLTSARYAAGMMADALAFVPKTDVETSLRLFESLAGWVSGPEWGLDLRENPGFDPKELIGKLPFSFVLLGTDATVTGWQVPVFVLKTNGEVTKSTGEEGKFIAYPHSFNEVFAEEDFILLDCPKEEGTGITDFESLTEFLEQLENVEDL